MRPWIGTLIAGHRAGDWTLPADLVTLHDARERLTGADVPDNGELPATRSATVKLMLAAAQTGEALPGADGTSTGRRSLDFTQAWEAARADAVAELDKQLHRYDPAPLWQVLQDALDECIKGFRADMAAAGAWAAIDPHAIPLRILEEPDDTREAVARLLGDGPRRYAAIRQAWGTMRPGQQPGGFGYHPGDDPTLPLAEIRNAPEILGWTPDTPRHHTWKTGMVHQWVGEMIRRGAHFWTPSPDQQRAAHLHYFPPRDRHRGFVNSFTALDNAKQGPPPAA